MNWEENTQAKLLPNTRNGVSSCWRACCIMQPPWGGKSVKSALEPCKLRGFEVMAPATLCQTILGSTDAEILKITEQVYQGECVVAPSVLPCWWQEECIKELYQELAQHMARAGLQSWPRPARPTSPGRRCSHGHSTSWSWSPLARPWGGVVSQTSKRRPLDRAIWVKKAMFLCRNLWKSICPHNGWRSTRDFWTVRQEKTLALAIALQCCAGRSGVLTRVLCNVPWVLQKCITPIMSLKGDDIVEASLLEPTGEEPRTSPTPEQEPPSWGRNLSH